LKIFYLVNLVINNKSLKQQLLITLKKTEVKMQTVIGLFDNAAEAQRAAQQLKSMGFTDENVDVSVTGGNTPEEETNENSNAVSGTSNYSSDTFDSGNVSGTTSGMSSGNYRNDNSDTFDSGNVSGDTSGMSPRDNRNDNDDSFGDKVGKFFRNLFGGDDDEADRYSHVASKSGNIVTVHAHSEDEAERAADILDEYGAVDVDERATQYGYSGNKRDSSSNIANTDLGDTESLNVIKEDIQVGKREVETGGVRLRSRIVERPVEETVRLREERVNVERNTERNSY
jgi:hypothetical protein